MGRSEKIKKTLFSKSRIIKEILENMKKYIIFFLAISKNICTFANDKEIIASCIVCYFLRNR